MSDEWAEEKHRSVKAEESDRGWGWRLWAKRGEKSTGARVGRTLGGAGLLVTIRQDRLVGLKSWEGDWAGRNREIPGARWGGVQRGIESLPKSKRRSYSKPNTEHGWYRVGDFTISVLDDHLRRGLGRTKGKLEISKEETGVLKGKKTNDGVD